MAGTCGRFRLFLDNLGCVYMLDGAADSSIDRAFSQEGRAVHAGSPVPEPQRVALQISIMGFSCRPCGGLVSSTCDRISVLSLGADSARLSAAALPLPLARRALGPTPSTTLLGPSAAPPFTGCFCSKYFHPEAAWIDAAACQWCTAFPPAAPGCRGASRKTRTPRPCPPPDSLGVSPSRCWVRRALPMRVSGATTSGAPRPGATTSAAPPRRNCRGPAHPFGGPPPCVGALHNPIRAPSRSLRGDRRRHARGRPQDSRPWPGRALPRTRPSGVNFTP